MRATLPVLVGSIFFSNTAYADGLSVWWTERLRHIQTVDYFDGTVRNSKAFYFQEQGDPTGFIYEFDSVNDAQTCAHMLLLADRVNRSPYLAPDHFYRVHLGYVLDTGARPFESVEIRDHAWCYLQRGDEGPIVLMDSFEWETTEPKQELVPVLKPAK
jgi:hypothetical protein